MYSVNQESRIFKTGFYLEEDGLIQGFKKKAGMLELEGAGCQGCFFLHSYDSEEEGMTWNRLQIKDNMKGQIKLSLYVFASDLPYVKFQGTLMDLDEVLQDPTISSEMKINLLLQKGAKEYISQNDILLYHFTGRYIWIAVKGYNIENEAYELSEIQVDYPMQTFVDYLPQIYEEGDDFFKRYIGIFESMYMDIEHHIDRVTDYLDVDVTPDAFLNELGSWVGIDNSKEIFDAEQMRQVIREATQINGAKGTKGTLERMIELYTGVKPIIAEQFKWNRIVNLGEERRLYSRLYGEESNCFSVIINGKKALKPIDKNKLSLLISEYKPATSKFKLIILEQNTRSDAYCYLGVNSFLAEPKDYHIDQAMYLNGGSLLQLR